MPRRTHWGVSALADWGEVLRWLAGLPAPRVARLTHTANRKRPCAMCDHIRSVTGGG